MAGGSSAIIKDPDGDVTLEVGQNNEKSHLLVSSKVLALASPVFARMLQSQFKEGLSSRSSADGKPRIIQLPEDDSEAFTFLCHILHFRKSAVAPKLTMILFGNIATVCHKWDFIQAVAPLVETWLQQFDWSSDMLRFKLLSVAYSLDAPRSFFQATSMIVKEQVGPFVHLPGLDDDAIIPENLLGVCNAQDEAMCIIRC